MNNPEFKEQLLNEVREAVKITVNGKIDKLNTSMDELKSDFKKHVDVVQPIIEQFNDRRGFWNTLSNSSKRIGLVSAAIIGISVILTFLMKFKP